MDHMTPSQQPLGAAAATNSSSDQCASTAARPLELHKVLFRVEKVNNHTLFNPWIVVDETRNFAFQAKEKKAYVTQQCRIIVKGSKHFPLQVASGPTTDALYHTWRYCQLLDEQAVPKELDYKSVETWIRNHIQELARQSRREPSRSPATPPIALSDTDEEVDEELMEEEEMVSAAPAEKAPSAAAAAVAAAGAGRDIQEKRSFFSFSSFFRLSKRPRTKEEWARRAEIQEEVKQNRRLLAMIVVFIYTLLMRVMSFDGYLLLLILMEGFTFVVFTRYKEISIQLAKRAAQTRVEKAKDWFRFSLRRKEGREEDEN